MNKVTLALAVTTAGLTLLSIHLWRQLDAERERAQATTAQHAALQARVEKLEREKPPAPASGATPIAPAATSAAQPSPVPPRREAASSSDMEQMAAVAQHEQRRRAARRRMLEDPRERELLMAQARAEARAENRDMQRELQLSDAEFAQVIERLAGLDLDTAAVYNRTDSIGGETVSETQALNDQFAHDLATLLGHEKAEQYAAFQDTRQVRTQVRALRGRLSEADALTEEQNQRLIAALQEQRAKFNDEMKRRVPSERVISSMGTWDGALVLADSTLQLSAHEQILQHLEEFRKRQRQAAVAVLSTRQLRVFDQMQEEQLASERVNARHWTLTDEGD